MWLGIIELMEVEETDHQMSRAKGRRGKPMANPTNGDRQPEARRRLTQEGGQPSYLLFVLPPMDVSRYERGGGQFRPRSANNVERSLMTICR